MKATFLEELGRLAADCNVQLAKREAQVASWSHRWGAEDDEAIRAAFRFLREPGVMRGGWPSFGEMATAIDRGRAEVRRRMGIVSASGAPHGERPAEPGMARRMVAAVVYARLNQRVFDRETMEREIGRFFTGEFSDEDIERFLREQRGTMATRATEAA